MHDCKTEKDSFALYGQIFAIAIHFLEQQEYHFTATIFSIDNDSISFSNLKKELDTYYQKRNLKSLSIYHEIYLILSEIFDFLSELDKRDSLFLWKIFFLPNLTKSKRQILYSKNRYYRSLKRINKIMTIKINNLIC